MYTTSRSVKVALNSGLPNLRLSATGESTTDAKYRHELDAALLIPSGGIEKEKEEDISAIILVQEEEEEEVIQDSYNLGSVVSTDDDDGYDCGPSLLILSILSC